MTDCRPDCPICHGDGIVCEDHPGRKWAFSDDDVDGCPCGAPGMPCPGGYP